MTNDNDYLVDINRFLPHRDPMLMVDLILNMDDKNVQTIFKIKEDNIFIENNFFVESGLIENMAQTCSSIVAKDYFVDQNNQPKDDVNVVGFISGIKKLKIHMLPKVGDQLLTKASLVSIYNSDAYSLCTMSCEISADENLLLEGEINLYIQENNSTV
jgi:predicted hotdog family 3-hydroxylacyl-ACP dehydratase